MLEMDMWFFALAAPAAVFAGISKGGFGSGAAFASSTILALVVEPGLALGIMLPLLMLIDVATLRPFWRKWDPQAAKLMILGSLPGVAIGAWFYTLADADVLRILIGVIAVGFVAWQVAQRGGAIPVAKAKLPDWVGLVAGLVAGFTSFVSHAGGPPAAMYMLSQRMPKTQYQGTSVIVFWAINIAKAVPYTFLGLFTVETLQANIILAPFALIGAWMGVKLHYMVSERLFFGLTYTMLLITGSKLIWDGAF